MGMSKRKAAAASADSQHCTMTAAAAANDGGCSSDDATILCVSSQETIAPASPGPEKKKQKSATTSSVPALANEATTTTMTTMTDSCEMLEDDASQTITTTVIRSIVSTTTSTATQKPASDKPVKVHPFFLNAGHIALQPPANVHWKEHGSVLVGTSGDQRPSALIAAFDFDGTLSIVKGKHVHAKDANDWQFVHKTIPERLAALHDAGYRIVIFSNQRGILDGKKTEKRKISFTGRVENVLLAIEDAGVKIPIIIFGAAGDDWYRKPRPGMWELFEEHYNREETKVDGKTVAGAVCQIDRDNSFYVGDAAGRAAGHKPGVRKDFADTDHKLALNVGCPFYTPESFFHRADVPPPPPADSHAVHPSHSPPTPLFNPAAFLAHRRAVAASADSTTAQPFIPEGVACPELVLIVGSPASGKSTFAKRYFVNNTDSPHTYVRVNQDELKTRDKCLRATEDALRAGHSVIVDNTNPDPETRKKYVDIAAKVEASRGSCRIPIRCMWHTASEALCMHNNVYRVYMAHKDREGGWVDWTATAAGRAQPHANPVAVAKLPTIAFTSYASRFKPPDAEKEGFDEVRRVDWEPQFESPQDEAAWSLYLV
ncbi:hypothetical protein HDU86_008512 [Geranomyces michiganensis]|nr:hypothetical protein HDU86_008512 [Geranomyces michiganensis]